MTREQRRNETTEFKVGLWHRLNHTCRDHNRLSAETTNLQKILQCGRILRTLISHHTFLQIHKVLIANKTKQKINRTNFEFAVWLYENKKTKRKFPSKSLLCETCHVVLAVRDHAFQHYEAR